MNADYYSAAAQILPVLYLALIFEQRAIGGTGPNVYSVYGLLVKLTAPPPRVRWGLTAFMVLLPAAQQRDDAEEVAHKLLRAIEAPMEVEGQSLSVTPSIGMAFFPDHGETPATLIDDLIDSQAQANFWDPSTQLRVIKKKTKPPPYPTSPAGWGD